MHKRLILLGLLLKGPMSGYRLHAVVAAHGELYRDLKKPNLYYLLARMQEEGLVAVKVEPGARGPRRERLVYSITPAGRREIKSLLRQVLDAYEPAHMGVEVAAVLLENLRAREAVELLHDRLHRVRNHRDRIAGELGDVEPGSASDHVLLLIDAEVTWLERATKRLESAAAAATGVDHAPNPAPHQKD